MGLDSSDWSFESREKIFHLDLFQVWLLVKAKPLAALADTLLIDSRGQDISAAQVPAEHLANCFVCSSGG
jgi:hypothetical protein